MYDSWYVPCYPAAYLMDVFPPSLTESLDAWFFFFSRVQVTQLCPFSYCPIVFCFLCMLSSLSVLGLVWSGLVYKVGKKGRTPLGDGSNNSNNKTKQSTLSKLPYAALVHSRHRGYLGWKQTKPSGFGRRTRRWILEEHAPECLEQCCSQNIWLFADTCVKDLRMP